MQQKESYCPYLNDIYDNTKKRLVLYITKFNDYTMSIGYVVEAQDLVSRLERAINENAGLPPGSVIAPINNGVQIAYPQTGGNRRYLAYQQVSPVQMIYLLDVHTDDEVRQLTLFLRGSRYNIYYSSGPSLKQLIVREVLDLEDYRQFIGALLYDFGYRGEDLKRELMSRTSHIKPLRLETLQAMVKEFDDVLPKA